MSLVSLNPNNVPLISPRLDLLPGIIHSPFKGHKLTPDILDL